MKNLYVHISSFMSILILVASLLPSVHSFHHEHFDTDNEVLSANISDAGLDCDLCDFHLGSATTPQIVNYDVFVPQKEVVYSLSLAETINLFPKPLFSLRAPPAVIA